MSFDKDTVKEQLTIEDIYALLEDLNGEPEMIDDYIVSKTICHNGDSHKLYYYDNTQLFRCYTHCSNVFDIFDLVSKVKDIDLDTSIYYVVNFFNLQHRIDSVETEFLYDDWRTLKKWSNLFETDDNKEYIKLPEIDKNILQNYPQPYLANWEKEFIPKEVCDYMNIRYNPTSGGILIPHYDRDNRLIGIRERTLIQENEKYGKYRPSIIGGKMYNHPLSFALYGLNKNKKAISTMKTAIIFESEKSVLKYGSFTDIESNIAVACCGSSISEFQIRLLKNLGVENIIIALDKQWKIYGDKEYKIWEKKFKEIAKKCRGMNISYLIDTDNIIGYKDSPIDRSWDAFYELFLNRKELI